MAILALNLDLGLLEPSGNYNLAVKLQFSFQIWTRAFWSLLAITIWLWNDNFGSKSGPGPFGAFWQLQFGCEIAIFRFKFGPGPFGAFWQLQFGCEMALLALNLDLGLLEHSGNYNLAVKLQFSFQIWTRAFWSLLAITIWLWNDNFGSKSGPGPFGAFWGLQFGCEIAILVPNLDLGLLEPSGNYNLAVKWQFWLQIWTWAFWSLLAIIIWLWNGNFGSKSGLGPFGAFWRLQFGREIVIWPRIWT